MKNIEGLKSRLDIWRRRADNFQTQINQKTKIIKMLRLENYYLKEGNTWLEKENA
jgi:hypothetical protein